MNRRNFLKTGAVLSSSYLSAGFGLHSCGKQKMPNILFLFSDDQRYNTIHRLGNPVIQTPVLDKLVDSGIAFTQCYVENPICTPSRASVLTGATGWSHGVRWFGQRIKHNLALWPQVFGSNGYRTFFTGKWHNVGSPRDHGFEDTNFVFPRGMGNHEMIYQESDSGEMMFVGKQKSGQRAELKRGGRKVEGFSSELFANAAIDFLESNSERPFFAFISFTAPHDPRTPPARFRKMYDPEKIPLPTNFLPRHPFDNGELDIRDERLLPWPRTPEAVRSELALYYGMISHLDSQVGRILEALERTGLDSNTIVIFAADNGLAVGSHGLLGKMSMYDHSVRVPLMIRDPQTHRSGMRTQVLCYLHDIFPTVCEIVGIPIPATVEGLSLMPVLRGRKDAVRDAVFCSYRDVQRMVRTQKFKLIWYPKINKLQFFDMAKDPDELNDLAMEFGRIAEFQSLKKRLVDWQNRVGDDAPRPS